MCINYTLYRYVLSIFPSHVTKINRYITQVGLQPTTLVILKQISYNLTTQNCDELKSKSSCHDGCHAVVYV